MCTDKKLLNIYYTNSYNCKTEIAIQLQSTKKEDKNNEITEIIKRLNLPYST